MTSKPLVSIAATPPFIKALKRLKKKYPRIADDLKTLTDRLEHGETPGDQIRGTRYTVYKERIANTDAQRGQSGGYRVLYYIKTPTAIYLLYIYAKTEQEDVPVIEIQRIIEEIR